MISATAGGSSSALVAPGQTITVEVNLTSDTSDVHNSAIFRVVFSHAGLRYLGYSWANPYLNGTIDDDSKPLNGGLPLLLDASTLSGVGYPEDIVDVELSNVLPVGPNFGSGTIALLQLEVPADFTGASDIEIAVVPDQIALNGDDLPTSSGGVLTLIIPSPASALGLAGVGCLASARRRRGS